MKNRDIEVAEKTLVDLRNCTRDALESLPEGLRVGGTLNLGWCENLESLPPGLRLRWDLHLWGCENLKSLPSGLVVGGHLKVYWCKNLNDLPDDLRVTENIWYRSDTGFARDEKKIQELELRLPGKLKKR